MAQYPFDFREESTGALPAGVTSWNAGNGSWDVASIGGENRLRFSGDTANDNRGVGIDADDSDTNHSTEEILAVVRVSTKDSSGTHVGVYARWGGSVASADMYQVWLRGEDELQLARVASGSFTPRVSVAFAWSVDTDYLIRFRVTDNSATEINLKAKVWERGTSEPGTWDIDENETHSSGSNWFTSTGKGVICFRSSGSDRAYSWISIATEGETANDLDSSDTTAPTFTSAPTAVNISDTSFDIQSTIDEAGTIYSVVLANGATAPTSEEVKAGTGSGGAAAVDSGSTAATGGTQATISHTGLTTGTAYDVYVVAEDDEATPNLQSSPSLVNVTTTITSVTTTITDVNGNALANETGIEWAWSDTFTGNPTDTGTGETTDGSGVMVVDVPNTGLSSGQTGYLSVKLSSGNVGISAESID